MASVERVGVPSLEARPDVVEERGDACSQQGRGNRHHNSNEGEQKSVLHHRRSLLTPGPGGRPCLHHSYGLEHLELLVVALAECELATGGFHRGAIVRITNIEEPLVTTFRQPVSFESRRRLADASTTVRENLSRDGPF